MTGIDELSRVLGGIEAGLATVNKTLAEDRLASASYRTDVRREFTNLSDRLGSLESKNVREEGAWTLGKTIMSALYWIAALLAGFAGGYFSNHIPK